VYKYFAFSSKDILKISETDNLVKNRFLLINYQSTDLQGIKGCHSGLSGIFLRFILLNDEEHFSEGFPTSGNDKTIEP